MIEIPVVEKIKCFDRFDFEEGEFKIKDFVDNYSPKVLARYKFPLRVGTMIAMYDLKNIKQNINKNYTVVITDFFNKTKK